MREACVLPAELTIYTVGEWYPKCLAWAAPPGMDDNPGDGPDDELLVDASAVQEVDAAGVQLLVSLAKGLARRQVVLRLTDPSTRLAAACAMLGVGQLLDAGVAEEAAA